MKPKYDYGKKDKEIRGEIRKGMSIYGYNAEQMAIFLRYSRATFNRRMKKPEQFTLKDMRIMGEKLHIDFKELM